MNAHETFEQIANNMAQADTVKLKFTGVVGGDLHYNPAGSVIQGTVSGDEITPLSLPVFATEELPPFPFGD